MARMTHGHAGNHPKTEKGTNVFSKDQELWR
jgi:hypothetical protein